MQNSISESLKKHYSSLFHLHGANSNGVDWGDNQWAADLRNKKMLSVVKDPSKPASMLDVGCGYGALGEMIDTHNMLIQYHGIDIAKNMIDHATLANKKYKYFCADFLTWEPPSKYDYIVCNGILTQKLEASHIEMHEYSKQIIRKMFSLSNVGIAFNCMTTFVNFQKENLFYKNPIELLAWCMSELSPHVRLDAAYDLWYEYTIFIYNK